MLRNPYHAKGIIFRITFDELEEIEAQAMVVFGAFATYNQTKHTFHFERGATFKLRYLDSKKAALKRQGFQYTWICFEEAGNWPVCDWLDLMRACLRSVYTTELFYILTGNPGGVGHNFLKRRYIDPAPPYTPIPEDDECFERIYLKSQLHDNRILQESNPGYSKSLERSGPDWLVKAWLDGDWNVVAGGALDDILSAEHIVDDFILPGNWRFDRGFDWGKSSPFSVLWFAQANGEVVEGITKSFPNGTIFCFAEWYGADSRNDRKGLNMDSLEIARGIKEREVDMPYTIQPGPADSSIFDTVDEQSIGKRMENAGVKWKAADKRRGSRKMGLDKLREMLKNSITGEGPGLYFFSSCRKLIEHLWVLPSDPEKEDVDTTSIDHDYDALRYRINAKPPITGGFIDEYYN